MSIFCKSEDDIDFADIVSIMPCDQIVVRRPTSKWKSSDLKKLIKHIKNDLAFDGYETDIEAASDFDIAYLTILNPDYGLLPPKTAIS